MIVSTGFDGCSRSWRLPLSLAVAVGSGSRLGDFQPANWLHPNLIQCESTESS